MYEQRVVRCVVWSWLLLAVLLGAVACNDDNGINPFLDEEDEESTSPSTDPDSGKPTDDDAGALLDASMAYDAGVQYDAGKPPKDGGKAHPDAGPDMSIDAGTDAGSTQTQDAGHDAGLDAGHDADVDDEDAGIDPNNPPPLEIVGAWHSNFGGTELVTSADWSAFGSTVTVVDYDNEHNVAITQNPADDQYNPSKFNKVVWTDLDESGFFYCIVDYGFDTADAARESTMTADDSDPATSGCSGFAWTKLSAVIEIEGVWTNNYDATETIDSDGWTSFGTAAIIEYDNAQNLAITQNPADDAYNPSKFNRVVWTEIDDGQFYYCIVDYALETADDARNSVLTADASDPENAGCGSFAWTRLDAD